MLSRHILVNHLLEPPNRRSGISNYLFNLLGALLANTDFRYTLVTCWDADRLPALLRAGSLDVITLPYRPQQVVNVAVQALRLPGLLRKTGAALEFNPNPVGQPLPFRPRVVVVHDLYFETLPALYPPRHVFWWNRLFPPSLATAASVICVSHQTRADLIQGHPQAAAKSVVVHEANCIPIVIGTAPARAGDYALFVANVSPNKNAEAIVAAVEVLRRRNQALTIVHVGLDDAGRLAAARQRHRGEAGVVTLGGVDDTVLSSLYAGARFVLCPSLWEGFCLPLVEAQAHGAPVIASDIPILREVGGEGCLFIDPRDPVALADAMTRLATDRPFRDELAARALANAARFSWDRAARETEAVFRAALARPSSTRAGSTAG